MSANQDGYDGSDDTARHDRKFSRKRMSNAKFGIIAVTIVVGLIVAIMSSSTGWLNTAVAQQTTTTGSGSSSPTNSSQGNTSIWPWYNHGYNGMAPSTISTSGTATTKVDPDKFSVAISTETNGTTASEATSSNARLMAQVISALKALGIKDEQIATSNFNLYPVYSYYDQQSKYCPQIYPQPIYCQPNQVIVGYRASNSITVTMDANGSIDAGKIVDTSVNAGASNIFGVTFFISPDKQETIRDSLTQQAIAAAQHRADIAAGSLSMHISGVQSVNLNDVFFPIYSKAINYVQGAPSTSGSSTPVQPGQQDVSTNVGVVFYISPNNQTMSSSGLPMGLTSIRSNTTCTNPPGGPMIC
jgi:uncharacterized protein YggE